MLHWKTISISLLAWMDYSLEGGHTRVVVNTVDNRGKSETPAFKMLIEESSSERELRREATDAESDEAVLEVDMFAAGMYQCSKLL